VEIEGMYTFGIYW